MRHAPVFVEHVFEQHVGDQRAYDVDCAKKDVTDSMTKSKTCQAEVLEVGRSQALGDLCDHLSRKGHQGRHFVVMLERRKVGGCE